MSMSIFRDCVSSACNDGADPFVLVVTLFWDGCDPDAVTMIFPTRPKAQPWTFSRDLLVWGLSGEAGEGDVRVASDAVNYTVTLLGSNAEEGLNVDIMLPRSWVEEFLTATTLPSGVDPYRDALDAALAEILAEAA